MQTTTTRFDPWDPSVRANPQRFYARMRDESPVYRCIDPQSDLPVWFVTTYELCTRLLMDQTFGKDYRQHLSDEQLARQPLLGALEPIERHMLRSDPPDHTRLRALVRRAFSGRFVADLEPHISAIAEGLADELSPGTDVDLISAFAFPLPVTVISEILGIPADDRAQFRAWSQTLVSAKKEPDVSQVAGEFTVYMEDLVEERSKAPGEDLISALLAAEEAGDRLSRQELLSMMLLLLIAGHETTVNLIGNGTLALLQHPDQLQLLRSDPSLVESAVEEILRYNGPVESSTLRFAAEETDLGGKRIGPGDTVLAVLVAANRDPAHFPNPDRFDITRSPNRHIAFGHGIHFCVGAPLARMEGKIAFEALLPRFPDLELAADPDKLEWTDSLVIHGPRTLPVRL